MYLRRFLQPSYGGGKNLVWPGPKVRELALAAELPSPLHRWGICMVLMTGQWPWTAWFAETSTGAGSASYAGLNTFRMYAAQTIPGSGSILLPFMHRPWYIGEPDTALYAAGAPTPQGSPLNPERLGLYVIIRPVSPLEWEQVNSSGES